jgi:hypothetical protein
VEGQAERSSNLSNELCAGRELHSTSWPDEVFRYIIDDLQVQTSVRSALPVRLQALCLKCRVPLVRQRHANQRRKTMKIGKLSIQYVHAFK